VVKGELGQATDDGGRILGNHGSGYIGEQPKTSSGQRVVDLDSLTVEMLRDHRKRQEKDAQALRMPPPSIVFPRNGLEGWCHPNTLSNTLERLAKEAGCPEVTARSLRHFHATVSLQASQNVVVVSKRLGHSKVSITLDIYAHALPGWQKEVAEAFAREMDQES
jgi:integrase